MVFCFFMNCWISVARSHSHEVLGFWRGVELWHRRVRQCSHGEGRVASGRSPCPQEKQIGAGTASSCNASAASQGRARERVHAITAAHLRLGFAQCKNSSQLAAKKWLRT